MRKRKSTLTIIFALTFNVQPLLSATKVVLGYYAPWAIQPEQIAWQHLTHIAHAFAGIGKDGSLYPPKDAAVLVGAAHKRDVKVLLSLGGSGSGAVFSKACADAARRKKLITAISRTVDQFGYDGVDVDWEHPGNARERLLHGKFSKELREELDALGLRKGRRLLLSCAVNMPNWFAQWLDRPQLAKVYDYINCMTYDYHGWAPHDGHNSSLFRSESCDCPATSDYLAEWVAAGVPREKLLMGIAFYGREHARGPGDSFLGRNTHKEALWYRDIISRPGYSEKWDSAAKMPFRKKEKSHIYYDSPRSISLKVRHIESKGYGGAIIWCLGQDRDEATGKQPLLESVGELLR